MLKPDGIARIDVHIRLLEVPATHAIIFEICDEKKKVSFWNYIKRFPSLKRRKSPKRHYLEMSKAKKLDMGLEFQIHQLQRHLARQVLQEEHL